MGPIVREWRRSWRAKPPDMDASHPHWGVIRCGFLSLGGAGRGDASDSLCYVRRRTDSFIHFPSILTAAAILPQQQQQYTPHSNESFLSLFPAHPS